MARNAQTIGARDARLIAGRAWAARRGRAIVAGLGLLTGLATAALVPLLAIAEPLPRSVLFIDELTPIDPWFTDLSNEFIKSLSHESSNSVYVYVESLGLAAFESEAYYSQIRDHFREKYRNKPIGVIVAHASLAFPYALSLRDDLWPHAPVIFTGVHERTAARMNLPADVTGVTFRLRMEDMADMARRLVPDLKQLVLVGDRLGSNNWWKHYGEDRAAVESRVAIMNLTGLPMSELKQRVSHLPSDSAIAFVGLTIDGAGARYVPRDAVELVAATANRPIFVDAETFVGAGAVGGLVVTPAGIGEEAARRTWRILNGASPSSFPITDAGTSRPIFDWRQLQRFGISEARLPPGSDVRFRELSIWERYRWQLLLTAAVLAIQALLIIGLLHERRRRAIAEVEVRQRMHELAVINRRTVAGQLSASIAHEINQPLAAIVSSGSAALRWLSLKTPDLDEVRSSLQRIISDGHRAAKVVDTVRAMFKKDVQNRALVNVNDLVDEVLDLLRTDLVKHDVAVRKMETPRLPRVRVDRVQLQQVIINLVRNAIDSMSTIANRPRILRVRTERNETSDVLVSVEDSGAGLDADDVDKIFAPFFTTKPQGMGMGLSICRSIVEAHGGHLTARPGRSQGALFEIALPAKDDGGGSANG